MSLPQLSTDLVRNSGTFGSAALISIDIVLILKYTTTNKE